MLIYNLQKEALLVSVVVLICILQNDQKKGSPICRNYCLMHLDSVTQRKWYCVKRVMTKMGRLEDGWAKRDKQSCFFTTNTLNCQYLTVAFGWTISTTTKHFMSKQTLAGKRITPTTLTVSHWAAWLQTAL